MLSYCLNLKRRKVKTGKGGRIRIIMIAILIFVGLFLSAIQMSRIY